MVYTQPRVVSTSEVVPLFDSNSRPALWRATVGGQRPPDQNAGAFGRLSNVPLHAPFEGSTHEPTIAGEALARRTGDHSRKPEPA